MLMAKVRLLLPRQSVLQLAKQFMPRVLQGQPQLRKARTGADRSKMSRAKLAEPKNLCLELGDLYIEDEI